MRRSRIIMQASTILSLSSLRTIVSPPLRKYRIHRQFCSSSNGTRSSFISNVAAISSLSTLSVPKLRLYPSAHSSLPVNLPIRRTFGSTTGSNNTGGVSREDQMKNLLIEKLQAQVVEIKDVSGGCGDFYQILVVSPQFQGVTRIHTHRMVNDVLEKYIGKMHGLTLRTLTPAQYTELQKVKN